MRIWMQSRQLLTDEPIGVKPLMRAKGSGHWVGLQATLVDRFASAHPRIGSVLFSGSEIDTNRIENFGVVLDWHH